MLIEKLNLSQSLTDEKRSFYFSPSRAGGCQRAMFFEANGYEPDEESVNMHIFEDGRVHEDLTIKFLEANNVEIFDRQKDVNIEIPLHYRDKITLLQEGICPICQNVIPRYSIHGHIDGLFRDEDGSVGLFEHKAVNSDTMKKYKKNGVWEGYMKQLALYMRGLGLEKGVILVKNKNNATYLEAIFRYNKETDTLYLDKQIDSSGTETHFNLAFPKITEKIFEKFALIEEKIKLGVIPDYSSDEAHFCYNCQYRKHCEENLTQELSDKVININELSAEEKERVISILGNYLFNLKKKEYVEHLLEENKKQLLDFFISNKTKVLEIENIPIQFKMVNRTYYSFDTNKLKEVLTEEEFIYCLSSVKNSTYQSISIPPKKREILEEIIRNEIEKLANNKKTEKTLSITQRLF